MVSATSQSKSQNKLEALESLKFPKISYDDFKTLPFTAQRDLIARNRIVNTDTYNRTMAHLSESIFTKLPENTADLASSKTSKLGPQATFVLQLRRSPFEYLVSCGVEDMVESLTLLPITQAELDFAKEFYSKHSNLKFFNEKMWQEIVDKHDGLLPFEIRGLKDGNIVLPSEPLFTVKGPEELIAHFEHDFHRVFYTTLVATRSNVISNILGSGSRFIEVGKRGAINETQHIQALKASIIGGGINLSSNDAGAVVLPIKDVGTIGHRYVQRFNTEEESFRHAIELLDSVTLLVDLIDTYKGIDLAIKLKQEYRERGKKIWVRLDSGDILDQVRYFLNETNKRGLTDPNLDKLIVEGIDGLQDIIDIEAMITSEFGEAAKARVLYGAGGLLISEKTSRSDASSGFKISEYTDEEGILQPSMKFSNSKGKTSYPGEVELKIVDGQRKVAQVGEEIMGQVLDLFEPLYLNGDSYCNNPDSLNEARGRVVRQSELFSISKLGAGDLKALRATASEQTERKIEQIYSKYDLTLN
jgi:putative nicotinate phosphoribosyltransferase